jgi:hypothetical protein
LDHNDVTWDGSIGGEFWGIRDRGEDEIGSYREE